MRWVYNAQLSSGGVSGPVKLTSSVGCRPVGCAKLLVYFSPDEEEGRG